LARRGEVPFGYTAYSDEHDLCLLHGVARRLVGSDLRKQLAARLSTLS